MKGILMTPDNLKATIELRKTQTRRVIKPVAHGESWLLLKWGGDTYYMPKDKDALIKYSRYQVGEVVYIKEAWAVMNHLDNTPICDLGISDFLYYKVGKILDSPADIVRGKWRSPLFMPAWAARYFITIEDVRAERLQEISNDDAKLEGVEPLVCGIGAGLIGDNGKPLGLACHYIAPYKDLWDSINKPPYDWNSKPWVFVYTYSLNKGGN